MTSGAQLENNQNKVSEIGMEQTCLKKKTSSDPLSALTKLALETKAFEH
jgi:hypothetical protein